MRIREMVLTVCSAAMLAAAWAQTPSWPTHRGNPERTGVTVNSRTDSPLGGPGNQLLAWTFPLLKDVPPPAITDNYTPIEGSFNANGVWFSPLLIDYVDDFYYDVLDFNDPSLIPYMVAPHAPADIGGETAWAEWRSPIPTGAGIAQYRVFAWIPSGGTRVNAQFRRNTTTAVYEITDRNGTEEVIIDQSAGGWVQIGGVYTTEFGLPLSVRLVNSLPPEGGDEDPSAIVIADAIRFETVTGGRYDASPVVIPHPDPLFGRARLVYVAKADGTMTCVMHDLGSPDTLPFALWSFVAPIQPTSTLLTVQSAQFQNDGWWLPLEGASAMSTAKQLQSPAVNKPEYARRALYRISMAKEARYTVHVRFNPSKANARKARYRVLHAEGESIVYVDQTQQEGSAVLGTFKFNAGAGQMIEVSTYSDDPIDEGAYVVTGDVRIQEEEQSASALFSTPWVGTVNIDGTTDRLVVIFGSNNGRVYCLDAMTGDQIWEYAAANAGPYGFNSPIVVREGTDDFVVIGNSNGRVYCFRTRPNDPDGDIEVRWTFPEETRPALGAFVSSPAYDAASGRIFIGSLDGRAYSIFFSSGDIAWAYPYKFWNPGDDADEAPLGAITATPAVFGGAAYFPSQNGRIYALDIVAPGLRNHEARLRWQYPDAASTELQPFLYSSPATVAAVPFGDPNAPTMRDVLYVGNSDGRVYALNLQNAALPDDQRLLWRSENLAGSIFSSPTLTKINDVAAPFTSIDAIVVGTNSGELFTLYANDRMNQLNTSRKAFKQWTLIGNQILSSPAVAGGFLYVGDNSGFLYAFNESGGYDIPEQWQDEIQVIDPGDTDDPVFPNIKVLILSDSEADQQYYNDILAGNEVPDILRTTTRRAFEWGEKLYVVFYWTLNQPLISATQFEAIYTGRGTTFSVRATPRVWVGDPSIGIATAVITVQWNGTNYSPPGSDYLFMFRKPLTTGNVARMGPQTEDLNEETANQIERFDFSVGNPLYLSAFGTVGTGDAAANAFNGNGGALVSLFAGLLGIPISHGQSASQAFQVGDRSKVTATLGQTLPARAVSTDLGWQGGALSVLNPLPWDQLPFSIPNVSLDYPDIPSRQLSALFQGAIDMTRSAARLRGPLINSDGSATVQPDPVIAQIDVPRFQSANERSGFLATVRVYIDSTNNGQLDGLNNLAQTPPPLKVEAYRELTVQMTVPANYAMAVEEETVDLGKMPAGFGYSSAGPNDNNSPFMPILNFQTGQRSIFYDNWRPFTLKNLGNVNLYRLFLSKQYRDAANAGVFPLYMYSDTVSPESPINMAHNLASNLDPRFFPISNRYWGPQPQQPYATLHKARPGDYAPTYMSLPDLPYGVVWGTGDPVYRPMVGLGVPPFTPVGTYSQFVYPYMLPVGTGTPGVIDYNSATGAFGQPVANPTLRVVASVRETRLTGGTNAGLLNQIDLPQPPGFSQTLSNFTPTVLRRPTSLGGGLLMVWSSNRLGAATTPGTASYLFSSQIGWNSNNLASRGWGLFSNNPGAWWRPALGPFPDPTLDLYGGATTEEMRTARHGNPVLHADLTAGGAGDPYVFWTATVLKEGRNYHQLYAAPMLANAAFGNPVELPTDPSVVKGRPTIMEATGFPPGVPATWVFYPGSTAGRREIYYLSANGRMTDGNWNRERKLTMSRAVKNVESVNPVFRTVRVNNSIRHYVDVFFIGSLNERNVGELLYSRYSVDRGNLQGPSVMGRQIDEVAQKEKGENVYRTRHLDWTFNDPSDGWEDDDVVIKINGQIVTAGDPDVDEQTGRLWYRYIRNGREVGLIVIDPLSGTIRFTDQAPRLSDIVSVTYSPRVLRIVDLSIAGDHSQLNAFLQRVENPRHNRLAPGQSLVRRRNPVNGNMGANDIMPVDRIWMFYRRSSGSPSSAGSYFYKTLRMGIQLNRPILAIVNSGGTFPLQSGATNVAAGANHFTILNGANDVLYYEVDWARGRVYFTALDESVRLRGRDVPDRVTVRYLGDNGQILTETHEIRWLEEATYTGQRPGPQFETPVPIDLPINEATLWASPNIELRRTGLSTAAGLNDEGVFLFWATSRNGVPDIYAQMLQPRFYYDNPDQDAD
ncbi:MAG: PQQ-binding-like beta-propeller repeat protein [Armatimonadetes bacterium]|nr:PQQ-binding-like beta-propeller repeat protein [Armatimonadota bacterium]